MKTFLPSFSRYLFSYLLLICFVNGASCSASDVGKLLSFKSKLSNPGLLRNWVSGQDPCTFTGVKCLSGSGISAINLDGVSLSVEFRHVVECLFSVSNLESLSLTRSSLSGSVGVGKAWCSGSLLDLDLSGNALTGSLKDVDQLSICSGLRSLNLSSNLIEFGESGTGSFKLRKLQSLDLSFNRLHGADVVSGIVSGGCENLKQLSLNGNKITGEVDVSGCVNLLHLDISSNNFSATFPSLGANCLSLEHLDLSSNKFSGEIVDKVVSCTHLRLLNLSGNQFTGSLPTLASTTLDFLYLSNNDFTGSIPSTLADDVCGSVIELDLSGNAFSGTVPASLGSCSVLNFFSIAHNNLTGELPIEVFLKMTKLKKLSVSFNQFTGTLPDSLREIPNLETLDLSSNNISGSVPSNLCNNPSSDNLKELYLQNNLLSGEIPETIGNCSNLVSLDLSFNYLTGKIPTSIGSLSKLKDLIIWFNQLEGEIPQELENLKFLENLILDFNYLTGTIPSGLRKCTNLNWISLSNNRLTGEIPSWIGELNNLAILKLSNNSFHGPVPRELGDCKSLIWVDLNSNFLNGTIPVELFKQSGFIVAGLVSGKRFAYAKRYGSDECHGAGNLMDFAGIREEQLLRLSTRSPCNFTRIYRGIMQPNFNHNGSMIFLDISFNELSGEIPKQIGSMYYLYVLNLGHNDLSGLIPAELGNMRTLNILDLSSNRLQGPIPNTLSSIASLTELDLSNNMLSGQIPESGQFEVLPASGFLNNAGLCGIPLSKCGANSSTGAGSRQRASRREASLAGSVAMGLLFSLFCVIGFVLLAIETRKRRRMREEAIGIYADSNSHSVTSNWKLTGAVEASSITLAAFDKPLRKLTFGHLLEATNGFHNDSLIGSGGFGDVYKAKLKDGNTVAIKKLIHMSGQGDREFMAEMETIGKIKHRNLVPLLGYCKVGEERLLVYEYMRYGSLDDVLHGRRKGGMRLNWAARRKIGIGAARGLAFLHHSCIPHIIHRDMKSSNVLLDENLEARVSDFGMARFMSVMDTLLSVSTLAGTPGYVPPEYYQSFKCSAKGDVYSFGVVLLELLTGKRPTDSPEFGDNNLVGWVKQHAKLKIRDVFDQELLKADPSVEMELLQHLKVACACLDDRHWKRPTMIQVMAMFKEIQAGSGVVDSGSTISADDGRSFGADMIEMTIKEHP